MARLYNCFMYCLILTLESNSLLIVLLSPRRRMRDGTSVWSQHLRSTAFQICYSLIIVRFKGIYSETLTGSQNKPPQYTHT
jgi:hypothetical protein